MAAKGDVYTVTGSIAAGARLDLRPASGEVIIHNIAFIGPVDFEWYDGTNTVKFGEDPATGGFGGVTGGSFHCTAGVGYRVKNTDTVTRRISADGIYSKAT